MKLKELLPDYLGKVSDDKLNSVSLNSQEISKGDLYISIATFPFKKNIVRKL